MNILVVSQYFYPETFRVNDLCSELVERGHSVTVLTGYPQYPQGRIYDGFGFNKPYEKTWNGVNIVRVKMRPRGKSPFGLLLNCLSFVTEGKKWVRKCKVKYDVVYVFEVSPVTVGLPAVAYKKKFGTPLFFNVQDLWPENVEVVLGIRNKLIIGAINRVVDKIYSASSIILCSSRGFVENIAKRGVPEEKLVYWPQFCEAPILTDSAKPSEYSDKFFNIVFAGNLGDAQGLDLLVETAARMKEDNVRWFLVGDGRAKERLQNRVAELGLGETVVFVGKVSEKEANVYIHFADCAYLSFKDNALFDMTVPAKLQTYLACGTPILAVAGGESRKIVLDGNCGVSCDRNADEVASSVLELKSDSERLSLMKENAKKYYEDNFTPEKLINTFEELLNAYKG